MHTTTGKISPAQVRTALAVLMAAAEAIRDAERIPSGILYSVLSSKLSLDGFESMVNQLVRMGLIRREGDELVWTGPAAD